MKTLVVYLIAMLCAATVQIAWIATAHQPIRYNSLSAMQRDIAEASMLNRPLQLGSETMWHWITQDRNSPCHGRPTDGCCEITEQNFKEAWPFEPWVIDTTFDMVARIMYITPDPAVPKPSIRIAEDFSDEEFAQMTDTDTYGDQRGNVFSWKTNTVMLTVHRAKVHTLAHELVHYFQFWYKLHGDVRTMTTDPEPEAVRIQRMFE